MAFAKSSRYNYCGGRDANHWVAILLYFSGLHHPGLKSFLHPHTVPILTAVVRTVSSVSLVFNRGRRIIDAPPASSGLHAVLGPEHVVQIRSWRKTGDHSVNGNNSSVNGNDSSMSGSGSGNSEDQAPSGGEPTCAIVEREIVRLCSGKNEKARQRVKDKHCLRE